MKLILDADSLVFKSAITTKSDAAASKDVVKRVKEIQEACFADETEMYVKGRGNYRYNLYPNYKAKRKSKDLEEDLKERLNAAHSALVDMGASHLDGYEADDLCCMAAYRAMEADEDYVIGYIDKDLLQIPGNHYNFNNEQFIFMEPDEADMFFWAQCLEGDSIDNVPGVKGIGPAKASKILDGSKLGTRHRIITDQYNKAYGNNNVLFNQYCSSLWLLRDLESTFTDWVDELNGVT